MIHISSGVLLAIAGVVAFTPQVADAAPVTTTFCIEYSHSFADASTGDSLIVSTTAARGTHIQIVRESDSVVVNDFFLSEGGGSPGCITFDGTGGKAQLDTSETYTVKIPLDASLSSNTFEVQSSSGANYTQVPKTGLTPTGGHTYSHANGDTWARLSATNPGHIMAAVTHALNSKNAGLSGENFVFRNDSCPSGGGSCYDDSTEIIWIGAPSRKFTIAYMMGLAVAHFKNGRVDVNTDNSSALNGCVPGASATGPTLMNTKEYTSEAAYHGWGLFYAAAVFNNESTDADCDYESNVQVDWSADGDTLDAGEDQVFSCEDSPAPGLGINDEDYVDQFCRSAGNIWNVGTKYDWLRILWDFRTNSGTAGYTVADLFDIFVDADPDTWNANGAGADPDDPFSRLTALFDFGDWVDIANTGGAY